MSEKVALVTGASSGIGRAACIEFAKLGCRVVLADVNEAGSQATAEQLGELLCRTAEQHNVPAMH